MGVNAGKPIGKNGILLALILGLLFIAKKTNLFTSGNTNNTSKTESKNVNALLTDERVVYTQHAKERMNCRQISKQEVEDILHNGKVNWHKTKQNDTPCATYALEGNTKDGQNVRIVFADCDNATKVITAIDLNNKYTCE